MKTLIILTLLFAFKFNLQCLPQYVNEVSYTFKNVDFLKDTNSDIRNQIMFIGEKLSIGKRILPIDNNSFLLVTESLLPSIKTENFNFFLNNKLKNSYKIGSTRYSVDSNLLIENISNFVNIDNNKILTFLKLNEIMSFGRYNSINFNEQLQIDTVIEHLPYTVEERINGFFNIGCYLGKYKNNYLFYTYRDETIGNDNYAIRYLKSGEENIKITSEKYLDTIKNFSMINCYGFEFEDNYLVLDKHLKGDPANDQLISIRKISKKDLNITQLDSHFLSGNYIYSDFIKDGNNVNIFVKKNIDFKNYANGYTIYRIENENPSKLQEIKFDFQDYTRFYKIKKINDSQFIGVGNVYYPKTNNTDFLVTCFDTSYKVIWQRHWGGDSTYDNLNDFYKQDGKIYLTGSILKDGLYHSYFANLELPLSSIEDDSDAETTETTNSKEEIFDLNGLEVKSENLKNGVYFKKYTYPNGTFKIEKHVIVD